MNCPLCGTDMEQEQVCPNCGTPLTAEEPAETVMEPEAAPVSHHPGIFYDNLISAQETYEEEHKAPKESRFEHWEKSIMTGAAALLVLMLVLVRIVSGQYDPDAIAIKGNLGIRMDNRTFAIYYQNAYQSFVSQYSDSLPFSTGSSLKKQYYNLDAGYSWEDYFIAEAYSTAALTERLVADAGRNGFSLDEEAQAALDATWETISLTAEQNRMETEEYLQAMYGPSMTEETYREYLNDSALAQAYSEFLYYGIQFTGEEIQRYYQANSSSYSDLTISEIPNVDVRHIMFLAADDTQEAEEAAKTNAEDALRQCHSSGEAAVEEIFLNLVVEYSQDSGSNANGGLLENVAPGQLGGEFDQWCFDAAGHEYGDTAVVSSQYGYHVVYFVGYQDTYLWKETVLADMRSQALSEVVIALTQELDCSLTRFAAAED